MIVSGGNSCYDGMPERIRNDVEKILHMNSPSWKMKMISSGPNERAVCPWLGGSILASLGSMHEMWMAKSEYEEYGAALIDRKCP
jgi:actin-related protein